MCSRSYKVSGNPRLFDSLLLRPPYLGIAPPEYGSRRGSCDRGTVSPCFSHSGAESAGGPLVVVRAWPAASYAWPPRAGRR